MKVIATKTGFDGQKVREEGEEFDMPDKAKGSWFSPVKQPAKAASGKDDAASAADPGKNALA